MTLVARHAVRTDIGRHREVNEDAAVVEPPLYAVCDGMGGARAGEVASQLACVTLAERTAAGDALVDAAQAANAAVYTAANADDALAGMGTTLTAMALDGRVARFAQVGDSRAYLLRDGELRQVSLDHSIVGQMIRAGELTVEEAAVHPMRSILTRALGTEPQVDVDDYEVDLRAGDVVLLCSDGLSGMVPDESIAKLLAHDDPDESADLLVQEACRAGGIDNITVVVVHLGEGGGDGAAAPAGDGAAARAGEPPATQAAVVDAGSRPAAATPASATRDVRRARRLKRRARLLKLVLAVLLVVLVLAAVAALALQSLYFVGVDDGDVVVYSGLPWSLGPLKLQDVYVRGTLRYELLTLEQRRLIDKARVQSRDDALRLLQALETMP